ncbi:MAG: transposase family protein [Planctomycetes bacterium]|nr:transposase family protein [Planctomycetota bacterium]
MILYAKEAGIAKHQTCELIQINTRRIERWEMRIRDRGSMEYSKPGPKQPVHALMPAERKALMAFVGLAETVDYSYQMLALKGAEQGLFFMSASSVRSILHAEELAEDRTGRNRRGSGTKPNRPEELRGPNQCWCWDISYLKTDMLRVFWYLYVLVDEWSRKVIAWRISRSLAHQQALALIDDAILAENLLEVPEEQMPVVVNDRGSQMKAKEVQQMFADLGLMQTFSRPRTPNDNPYVEALFGTVKTAPSYPGWFPIKDDEVVRRYFERYFWWYNNEHYHSRIGYVTPVQKHTGQAERIIAERKKQLRSQRERRKHYWLTQP